MILPCMARSMGHPDPAIRRVWYLTHFVLLYQSLTSLIVNKTQNTGFRQ